MGKRTINQSRFGLMFEENPGTDQNHIIIVTSSFFESFVSKALSVHTKTQSRRFQIPLVFKEHFRKALFSRLFSVDGRPNRINKVVFSNSYSVVWTTPEFFKLWLAYTVFPAVLLGSLIVTK